jgi:hypothetical protein
MSDKEIVLKPGWLKRQVDKAAEDVKRMPRWITRPVRQTMDEAAADNFGLTDDDLDEEGDLDNSDPCPYCNVEMNGRPDCEECGRERPKP